MLRGCFAWWPPQRALPLVESPLVEQPRSARTPLVE